MKGELKMAELVWDQDGTREYESGVDHVVLYKRVTENNTTTWKGYAWSGVTSITESPDGAEETELWADNIKYGGIRSAEKFSGSIEAYTWPDEWESCDGMGTLAPGVKIGQQTREPFCLAYRTKIGNDVNPDAGYRLHIIYNATCKPSEESHETINDSPDAATYSWDFDTTPVAVSGMKPTSHIEIDSTDFTTTAAKALLTALEAKLFGTTNADAFLPLPDTIKTDMTPVP